MYAGMSYHHPGVNLTGTGGQLQPEWGVNMDQNLYNYFDFLWSW